MDNIRTYKTLRLVRGKRRCEELVMLSEAKRDFEFRRLYISEVEQDLHVIFSRSKISNWISWIFLGLSGILMQFSIVVLIFSGIACCMKLYSTYCQKRFEKIFKGYKFALGCVDAVIENNYGIILPK